MNFISCDKKLEEANIVLFGVPFDSTSTYRSGSRFAPYAIRVASDSIETYSPYQDKDLEDFYIHDVGDLVVPQANPSKMTDIVSDFVANLIKSNKFPLMLGGEHLISLGAVKALAKKHKDLCIVHFDAHTDLRDEYLGEKLNHSTVMRRCFQLLQPKSLFQFGIRSGTKDEFLWAEKNSFLVKNNFNGIEELKKVIKNRPVYFSCDLDVLDSGEFCGTGTPEAGGVRFLELLQATKTVFTSLNVVGADIVELNPTVDPSGSSTSLACKYLREVLLLASC